MSLPIDRSAAVETATSGRRKPRVDARHRYCVYGIVVVSDTPLALPEYADGGLGKVECLSASASVFRTAMQGVDLDPRSDSWYRYAVLPDGSTYVRWDTIGEFLGTRAGR